MKFTGSSVEEAIQNGLVELNIPRKRAHITVVAREKKGFFGFGKKPAIVDIYVINETTIVKANQKAVRGVPTEINELNNYLTRDGFLLTMTDDEGNIHELGTNTFGLIGTQSEEEIRELVSGLTQSATGKDPEITITTWEEWNSNRK